MKTSKFTKLAIMPLGVALSALLVAGQPAVAATEVQIEDSITAGIAWLANTQAVDGSWDSAHGTAATCMALIKLQDRAPELGYDSPFDEDYPYSDNVLAGWNYVFGGGRTLKQTPLPVQVHGASNDDPDTNANGYGVYFQYDNWHNNYTTGLCLMALSSSGDPDRPNDGGLDFDGVGGADTYGELAQEATDWLAFSQNDGPGDGRGGWGYNYWDNSGGWADNSISGYPVLGLAAGQNFGVTVPQWVKNELDIWIDFIQNDANGASGYTTPTSWNNVLKTGNLLFEMTFVGDANTSMRFDAALNYIEDSWRLMSTSPGWGYGLVPANYQAMFTLMKGLEFSNVDLIDTDGDGVRDNDWFNQEPTLIPSDDFASVLVAQQNVDGSWASCLWGNPMLCTTWALLTLEKITPVSDPFDIEVEKDYRYTSVCFERDNDLDGAFGEDPAEYDEATGEKLPIDNDGDGLFGEDGIDCDPSDTGYELPMSGMDPEAYTLEAVLNKQGKVLNYNPGQYYAVSTVNVTRFNESVNSVMLEIVEDYRDCTIGKYPVSERSPKNGGGSVVVVEVKDGVAYQIYDAMSDAVTFQDECNEECSATAAFEYSFEEGQDEATLLVYVKFAPGLKGMVPDELPASCMNTNSAKLEVYEEGEEEPVFVIDPADDEDASADASLTVVEK